jgi:hypothetical protein
MSKGYSHGIQEGYTCLAQDSQVSKFRKKDNISILSPVHTVSVSSESILLHLGGIDYIDQNRIDDVEECSP